MVHTTVLESRRYFLEYCLERDRELSEPQKEFVGSRIACQHVCTLCRGRSFSICRARKAQELGFALTINTLASEVRGF